MVLTRSDILQLGLTRDNKYFHERQPQKGSIFVLCSSILLLIGYIFLLIWGAPDIPWPLSSLRLCQWTSCVSPLSWTPQADHIKSFRLKALKWNNLKFSNENISMIDSNTAGGYLFIHSLFVYVYWCNNDTRLLPSGQYY